MGSDIFNKMYDQKYVQPKIKDQPVRSHLTQAAIDASKRIESKSKCVAGYVEYPHYLNVEDRVENRFILTFKGLRSKHYWSKRLSGEVIDTDADELFVRRLVDGGIVPMFHNEKGDLENVTPRGMPAFDSFTLFDEHWAPVKSKPDPIWRAWFIPPGTIGKCYRDFDTSSLRDAFMSEVKSNSGGMFPPYMCYSHVEGMVEYYLHNGTKFMYPLNTDGSVPVDASKRIEKTQARERYKFKPGARVIIRDTPDETQNELPEVTTHPYRLKVRSDHSSGWFLFADDQECNFFTHALDKGYNKYGSWINMSNGLEMLFQGLMETNALQVYWQYYESVELAKIDYDNALLLNEVRLDDS